MPRKKKLAILLCFERPPRVVERLLQDERLRRTGRAGAASRAEPPLFARENLSAKDRVDPSVLDNLTIPWAAREGRLTVVERLLQDNRVDPSAENNDALRLAAGNNHHAVFERL